MKRTELTDLLINGALTRQLYDSLNALSDKALTDYTIVGGKVVKAIGLDSLQAYALYDFNRLQLYAMESNNAKGFLPYADIEIATWLKAFGTDTLFIAVPVTYRKRVKRDGEYTIIQVTDYQPQLLTSDDDITERLAQAYMSIKSDMNAYACTRQRLSKGEK